MSGKSAYAIRKELEIYGKDAPCEATITIWIRKWRENGELGPARANPSQSASTSGKSLPHHRHADGNSRLSDGNGQTSATLQNRSQQVSDQPVALGSQVNDLSQPSATTLAGEQANPTELVDLGLDTELIFDQLHGTNEQ